MSCPIPIPKIIILFCYVLLFPTQPKLKEQSAQSNREFFEHQEKVFALIYNFIYSRLSVHLFTFFFLSNKPSFFERERVREAQSQQNDLVVFQWIDEFLFEAHSQPDAEIINSLWKEYKKQVCFGDLCYYFYWTFN